MEKVSAGKQREQRVRVEPPFPWKELDKLAKPSEIGLVEVSLVSLEKVEVADYCGPKVTSEKRSVLLEVDIVLSGELDITGELRERNTQGEEDV